MPVISLDLLISFIESQDGKLRFDIYNSLSDVKNLISERQYVVWKSSENEYKIIKIVDEVRTEYIRDFDQMVSFVEKIKKKPFISIYGPGIVFKQEI